jgi:TonB family protein
VPVPSGADMTQVAQPTMLNVHIAHAAVDVVVVASSGNTALDQRVSDCYRQLPAGIVGQIALEQHMAVSFDWHDVTQPPPTAARTPSAAGYRHSCDENDYPVAALQIAAVGTTLLAFTITPQGDVTDITVRQSSGRSDLDDAAVVCAKRWLYRPAIRNGTPVASQHMANVLWQIRPTYPFSNISSAVRACVASTAAGRNELAQAAPPYTVTKAHFSNGVITDVVTVGRSHSPDLDRRTRECFKIAPKALTAAVANETDQTFVAYSYPIATNATPAVPLSALVCPIGYYPPEAIRLNQTGETTVAYGISASGDIKNVSVEKSSGLKTLDDAALLCAQQSWHYKPATQNGLPVESFSRAIVKWALEDPVPSPADIQADAPSAVAQTQNCVAYYPPKSVRLNEEGDVQLAFTVATDGTVKDAAVIKSSGHDLLDQAAAACVAQWRYRPAMRSGIPVAVSWQTIIRYHLSNGASDEPPPASEPPPDTH